MGDQLATVKVAAVQAASHFLDREASIEKACRLIHEAGSHGAQIIGFPEGFIPGHPLWYHHHPATAAISNKLAVELFKNAVEIPSHAVAALCAAARAAQAYVVIGVCERIPNTFGTLYNSQLYIGPNGQIIRKHQKIMPTVGERIVHTGGHGDTFGAFESEFGPLSGLICGENSNPLAIFALTAEGTRVHVMSWPNYISVGGGPLRNRVTVDSQAFAQMSKAFVVSACGIVDDHMIEILQVTPEAEKVLRSPGFCGGSLIVAPNGKIIAGPMGDEEGILVADCNLEAGVYAKLFHDFAGHYNRPDIFQLHVNRTPPQIYTASSSGMYEAQDRLPAKSAELEQPIAEGGLLSGPADGRD